MKNEKSYAIEEALERIIKLQNEQSYKITEALQLIIKLLTENEYNMPLEIYTEFQKAKIKYINSTLKLLKEKKDEKN